MPDVTRRPVPAAEQFINAAAIGKNSVLKSLSKEDESIIESTDQNNDTAFILSCRNGHKKTVNYLAKNLLANIYHAGNKKRTGFLNAVVENQETILKYLHDFDSSLCLAKDEDGNTALILSILHSKPAITEFLLEKLELDFRGTGLLERTAFHHAVISKNVSAMLMFKKLYAKYRESDFRGDSSEGLIPGVILKDFKTLFNSRDGNGDSALFLACEFADVSVFKLLVEEFKFQIDETGTNGRTCFIAATQNENLEILQYINDLDGDMCLQADDEGKTCRDYAKNVKTAKFVKFFVDAANLKIKNKIKKDRRNQKKQLNKSEEDARKKAEAEAFEKSEKIRKEKLDKHMKEKASEKLRDELEREKARFSTKPEPEQAFLEKLINDPKLLSDLITNLSEMNVRNSKNNSPNKPDQQEPENNYKEGSSFGDDLYQEFEEAFDSFEDSRHDFENNFTQRNGDFFSHDFFNHFNNNSFKPMKPLLMSEAELEANADEKRDQDTWERIQISLYKGEQTFYELLGVDRRASRDQVKSSFRGLVKKYHPDRASEEDDKEMFSEITAKLIEAHGVISDSDKREQYDRLVQMVRYDIGW